MAEWKISREIIEVYPHNNAEKLELVKCGQFQLVCEKGLHKPGDTVIMIPDKSVLPETEEFSSYKPYLTGPLKNRVKALKLRGELSCGIILQDKAEFAEVPIGEDLSEKLNIHKFEPEVPAQLRGRIKPVGNIDTGGHHLNHHDVEAFGINSREFSENDDIVITSKIHGAQFVLVRTIDGRILVSSKGMFKRSFVLEEEETNFYWQAAKNSGIISLLKYHLPGSHIQLWAEAIPCQKGFSYGQEKPTIKVFRFEVNGYNYPYHEVGKNLQSIWVPVLYEGKFNLDLARKLSQLPEQISGKNLHIGEGVVLSHKYPKLFIKGDGYVYLKILNPKYKEDEESFN